MPVSPPRTRLLAMAAVATLLLLAGVEVAARLVTLAAGYTPARPSVLDPVFAGSSQFGWVLRPAFSGPAEDAPSRSFDAEGYATVDTAQVADSSRPRVVFIGDSNTFGYGVPTEHSFVEVADGLLPGVDAINLGVPGYSSAHGVVVARKYLPALRPKVAVISFNFNDRRYSVGQPDGPAQFQDVYRQSQEYWLNRLAGVAERSHAYILFRAALRRAGLAPPQREDVRMPVSLDAVVPRVSVEEYRRNLEAIVATCLENGVLPVLMLLRDDPVQTAPLHAAAAAIRAGDTDTATKLLEGMAAATNSELTSLARRQLALVYRGMGRITDADAVVKVTLRHMEMDGQDPIRLDAEYNEAMTALARAQGIPIIDGAAILESLPDVFIDICHFNERGHRALGQHLASVLIGFFDGTAAADQRAP